ncbi:baculoviral IAP repeat-containing protein 7-like isoform X1 [Vespa velutina]|uniref:baculoviral IAP repeat-containing protein 7-like isoform X1 n=1 Tax=Vespa velutina TaxID=202808 RepID=UPI001FB1CDDF|nr:baculoviral IAP repeat-containing protein 7-like isoform X1 [Vespa velutina]
MNVEENRLRTFADWPTHAAVSADRIAKAGFYYSGIGLEVQCFLCGTKISEWNYGDQAVTRHRQAAPDCPFVLNPSNTCNIPLLPASANDRDLSSSSSSVEQAQSENVTEYQCYLSTAVRSNDPQRQYKTLRQRLESFANWPVSNIVSPDKLAKAGFYYLQQADLVECVFCRGIILQWELGDDPEREHRTHFPNCDFYIRRDNEDDVEDLIKLTNVKLMPGSTTDLKDLGIQAHTVPRRLKHATYEGRLRTFDGWPVDLRQTPEMLATAGFYYVGTEDQVRCFHCDGGLRNWEATDDPWVEHAKWFPKCGFVSIVQGPEFIKECIDNRPPLDPAIVGNVCDSRPPLDRAIAAETSETSEASESNPEEIVEISSATHPTVSTLREQLNDAFYEDMLQSEPAMAALEIGLHVEGVKKALKKRIEETGAPHDSADQLIADVLRNQAMDEDSRAESQNTNSSIDNSLDVIQYFLSLLITEQTLNTSARSMNNSEDSNTCPTINRENERENVQEECTNSTQSCEISDTEDKVLQKANTNSEVSDSLAEENRRLKEARLCKICMDREIAVVFLPCGHLATCVHCAPSLTYCPICRQEIRATVRTFLS